MQPFENLVNSYRVREAQKSKAMPDKGTINYKQKTKNLK